MRQSLGKKNYPSWIDCVISLPVLQSSQQHGPSGNQAVLPFCFVFLPLYISHISQSPFPPRERFSCNMQLKHITLLLETKQRNPVSEHADRSHRRYSRLNLPLTRIKKPTFSLRSADRGSEFKEFIQYMLEINNM